jgi:biopolymer transport protein ExbD
MSMDEDDIDSINVVPLVDVMLVLLTIVLTTATFVVTGRIPVVLAQSAQSAPALPAPVVL